MGRAALREARSTRPGVQLNKAEIIARLVHLLHQGPVNVNTFLLEHDLDDRKWRRYRVTLRRARVPVQLRGRLGNQTIQLKEDPR